MTSLTDPAPLIFRDTNLEHFRQWLEDVIARDRTDPEAVRAELRNAGAPRRPVPLSVVPNDQLPNYVRVAFGAPPRTTRAEPTHQPAPNLVAR
jgi:hypothetical protein